MLKSAELIPVVATSLGKILGHLETNGEIPTEDLRGRIALYARIKSQRGRAAVAEALGLKEAEFSAFDAVLRDVERTLAGLDGDEARTEHNVLITLLRLLSWMETIGQRVPALALEPEIEALVAEDVGRKQVRALELIVRSLITESYGSQQPLIARLREALNDKIVDRWQSGADPEDILSGCTFSELASLFVNKEEFDRYETIYEDTPFLTLLKQRRRTIQSFLDDVRRIRNVLAHHRRITNVQLSLLDLYYDEITTPVQAAFDNGQTTVDPGTYLDVSKEDLERYFQDMREDIQSVKDDIGDLRHSVMASLGTLAADTAEIKDTTRGMSRRMVYVGVGVVILIAATAFLLVQGDRTEESAEAARAASERTETVARETAETARDVAENVEEAAETTREAARAMEETTDRVVQTLEELRAGFAALTQTGGIIADARRPQEHYHNARIYEQRGDIAQAMQSYRRFFAFEDLEFVDPHLRFQAFLKLQNGVAGAREVYYDMRQGIKTPVMEFAWALLLESDARIEALETFLQAHPDFAPALYALSRDFSVARLGTQSMADKRKEKELLERFLETKSQGGFLRYYLDQSVASEQIEDAEERLAALATLSDEVLKSPVKISGSRSNTGWMITISIADTVKEIFYRIGTDGEFQSTGFVPGVHTHSGLPLAKPMIQLGTVGKTTIQIKYKDPRDREHGPYELLFDPDVMLIQSTKNILAMTKNSWLAFREMDPDKVLLYFTHLLSYRSALDEIRYGLDTDTPDRAHPFSPPDPKNPYAVNPNDAIYIDVPTETRYATVQLTFKDGTKSDIVKIER